MHHHPSSGVECKPIYGTGFLVQFPENDQRLGLVTNRHLVDLPFKGEPEDRDFQIKSVKVQWWQNKDMRCEHTISGPQPLYHSDPLIDVAIIPITSDGDTPPQATAAFYGDLTKLIKESDPSVQTLQHATSWTDLVEYEKLWPQLEPGEFVSLPGYPVWYDRLQIRPVMRSGIIASDPQTEYRYDSGAQTAWDSNNQVLFDAFSTNGNSGGPVYVAQRGFAPIDLPFQMSNGYRMQLGYKNHHPSFLIGINASHYNETGISGHNEHAGLSRMHKLSVIMDILRANQIPQKADAQRMTIVLPIPDGIDSNTTIAVRDQSIMALRRDGLTYKAIAAEVGCSASTVGKVVRRDSASAIATG